MQLLKKLFNFYIDASIHVALAVFAFVKLTHLTLNLPPDNSVAWFAFFSTIVSYNFIKYGVEAQKYIIVTTVYLRIIQLVSIIAFGLALYYFFKLSSATYLYLVMFLFLTALYAMPVLPQAKNLRSFSGLKIFIVALIWAGVTVVLPVVNLKATFSFDVKVEVFKRFLFVLVLILPFEIRDLKYDSAALKTLPQRFGIKRTKLLGIFLLVVVWVTEFFKDDFTFKQVVVLFIVLVITTVLLWFTKKKQPKYYCSFWVEGIPVLWWMLACMLL